MTRSSPAPTQRACRRRVHDLGLVRAPRPRLQRGAGHDGPQRQHGGVRHAPDLQAELPVDRGAAGDQRGPAGSTQSLRFTHDGYRGLDILAENQPYTRLVNCDTLQDREPRSDGDHAATVPGQGARRAERRLPRHLHLRVADRGRLGRHLPRGGGHGRLRPSVPRVLPLHLGHSGPGPFTGSGPRPPTTPPSAPRRPRTPRRRGRRW